MTIFNERETAFEAKFAHDETVRFLTTARRDKLFATWAADQLAVDTAEAAVIAAAALSVRNGAGHDGRLLAEVGKIFTDHGRSADMVAMCHTLAECARQARDQLTQEPRFE
jgi:hypothetical protein